MSKAQPRYQGKPRGPRWALLGAIVVLHLAALYGLSRLLVPDFTAGVEREVMSVFVASDPPPPPPPPPPPTTAPAPEEGAAGAPGEQTVPQPITAPPAAIVIQPEPLPSVSASGDETVSGARDAGEGTGAQGAGEGTGSGNQGSGQGNGIKVRPSVRSGRLDPGRDFPIPDDGRAARYGTSVTVVFTVTPDGRARDCSVARSNSDPGTAALVCPLVIEKIRFNPALTGAGVPGEARDGYRVDFRAAQP